MLEYGEKDRLIYCEDRKYGYMDLDGKVLIKARFDYAEAFYGDYALVRNGESHMVIGRQGNELYTFEEETTVTWEKKRACYPFMTMGVGSLTGFSTAEVVHTQSTNKA